MDEPVLASNIPRGTTPTFDLILEGVDLTEAANVYVTFRYKGGNVTKTDGDFEVSVEPNDKGVDVTTVSVRLDQQETLDFAEGDVKVQVNWLYSDGSRACSEIGGIPFGRQLLGRVLP